MRAAKALALCALVACTSTQPVHPTDLVTPATPADACSEVFPTTPSPSSAVLRGSVVYWGAKRGRAVVMLFRKDRPPPPAGSSGPINFSIVREEDLFGSAPDGETRAFTAPFAFAQVPAARAGEPPYEYEIRAFLDADRNWNPFASVLNQPTAGDVAGGYVDPSTGAPLAIRVQLAGGAEDRGLALENLAVVLGQELPLGRPVFELAGGATAAGPLEGHAPRVPQDAGLAHLTLRAVKSEAVPALALAEGTNRFQLRLRGSLDDRSPLGLPDVWPRVAISRLPGDAVETEWTREDAALALRDRCEVEDDGGRRHVLPAYVNPLPYLPALAAGESVTVDELDATVLLTGVSLPASLDQTRARTLQAPPVGRYAVLAMNPTGQVWRVPNELSRALTPDSPDDSQGGHLTVTPAASTLPGVLRGTVRWPAALRVFDANGLPTTLSKPVPASANAWVLLFGEGEAPPPTGRSAPRAATRASAVRTNQDGSSGATFAFQGLAPGQYTLRAILDTDGDFTPTIALLAGVTRDDLVTAEPWAVSIAADGAATPRDTALELRDDALSRVPFERAAFELIGHEDGAPITGTAIGFGDAPGRPLRFRVRAKAPEFPGISAEPLATTWAFALRRDGDGALLDANGDGLPDLNLEVLLVKQRDDDALRDDVDADGALTVIPAIVDPFPLLASSQKALGGRAAEVDVLAYPRAYKVKGSQLAPTTRGIPLGTYAIRVFQGFTGQTWRVPNELGPASGRLHPASVAALAGRTASQDVRVTIGAPQVALPGGEIRGRVVLADGAAVTGPIHLFAVDLANPPPPAGFGRPVALASIAPPALVAAGANGVEFSLPLLPNGRYTVVGFHDADRDFNPLFDVLSSRTEGDQRVALVDAGGQPVAIPIFGEPVTIETPITLSAQNPAEPLEPPTFSLDRAAPTLSLSSPEGFVEFAIRADDTVGNELFRSDGAHALQLAYEWDASGALVTNADGTPRFWPKLAVTGADGAPLVAGVVPTAYLAELGAPDPADRGRSVDLGPDRPLTVRIYARDLAGRPAVPGDYSIRVVQRTGQTWVVPNELGRSGVAALASQGVRFRVVP